MSPAARLKQSGLREYACRASILDFELSSSSCDRIHPPVPWTMFVISSVGVARMRRRIHAMTLPYAPSCMPPCANATFSCVSLDLPLDQDIASEHVDKTKQASKDVRGYMATW